MMSTRIEPRNRITLRPTDAKSAKHMSDFIALAKSRSKTPEAMLAEVIADEGKKVRAARAHHYQNYNA
jgi:hypothetical protein